MATPSISHIDSKQNPIHQLTFALECLKAGDFTVRLNSTEAHLDDQQKVLFDLYNECASRNESLAKELQRVVTDVGECYPYTHIHT